MGAVLFIVLLEIFVQYNAGDSVTCAPHKYVLEICVLIQE